MELIFDEERGTVSLDLGEQGRFEGYWGMFRREDGTPVKTVDYAEHICSREPGEYELGSGVRFTFRHFSGDEEALTQEFVLYDRNFVTVRLTLETAADVRVNEIAPLCYEGDRPPVRLASPPRFLAAPFDNDKWARFVDYPIAYAAQGYEFTVIHGEDRTDGTVIGSIDHDTWKTGLQIGSRSFRVYCGAATEDTRDLNGIPHGFLTGKRIASARIFLGGFADYQEGLRAYGACSAAVRPALPWDGPAVFGWNSWAALMGDLTLERYQEASSFMKELRPSYSDRDAVQYINFDAFWNSFSNRMREAVAYVERNGQQPGTYFCPFITGKNFREEVSGTDGDYCYEDLLLRDAGGNVLPPVDGLYSLDPTHPGTLMHMEYEIGKIIRWGFRFIKTDFVGHGCREGAFYRKEITTGVQAYCYGMQHFVDCVKKAPRPVLISLSIAPIFPHGYGHARRISCDAFGSLDQSAYLNNCTTYLWWMNGLLYRFNDPDHIVTYRTSDKHSTSPEEGRTRYHAGVLCGGLMITSDDYRSREARERAKSVLGNESVNALARQGKAFRPIQGAAGDMAADVFGRADGDDYILAVFNYSISDEKETAVAVGRLGLDPARGYTAEDLWTGERIAPRDGTFSFRLIPAQSRLFRVRALPAETA